MSLSLVEGEEDAKELKDFCKDHVRLGSYEGTHCKLSTAYNSVFEHLLSSTF